MTRLIKHPATYICFLLSTSIAAPTGYSRVSWRLDDNIIVENGLDRSDWDTRFVIFRRQGRHTLICLASDPESGDFRRITWVK